MHAPMEWAFATDEAKVLPCRPTISCIADIAPPGVLEVESGPQFSRDRRDDRTVAYPLLLKQTLTKRVQLQLGSNGATIVHGPLPARYFDSVYAGPKVLLHEQSRFVPALALTGQFAFPTANRFTNLFFTGHASKDFGWLHADANVGWNLWHLDAPHPQTWYALSFATTIHEPLGVALEAYRFSDARPAAPHDGGIRAVIALAFRQWALIDLGADAGFYPTTRAYTIFVGTTIAPVRFKL
jgi:hypothetical protein